ncbi:hypothetical protein NPIL_192711 [Nephila pilipes]|uniref:Uncharacterized protein n=1 Tax=Nephila pilipes TaxID=299642 RepID=A0A8X6NQD9_NEPPI|nr:hypothetical protein NPIL_192711 [Nephila pilipes]
MLSRQRKRLNAAALQYRVIFISMVTKYLLKGPLRHAESYYRILHAKVRLHSGAVDIILRSSVKMRNSNLKSSDVFRRISPRASLTMLKVNDVTPPQSYLKIHKF